jgi:hypothetical protein
MQIKVLPAADARKQEREAHKSEQQRLQQQAHNKLDYQI